MSKHLTIEQVHAVIPDRRAGPTPATMWQRNILWLVAHEAGAYKRHLAILYNRDGTTVCYGIQRARKMLASGHSIAYDYYARLTVHAAEVLARRTASGAT